MTMREIMKKSKSQFLINWLRLVLKVEDRALYWYQVYW